MTATTPANPTEVFTGKLAFVYPHVDQETRTLTVRFELPNPGHKLRPGTTATVKLKVSPKHLEMFAKVLADDWAKHHRSGCRYSVGGSGPPAPPPWSRPRRIAPRSWRAGCLPSPKARSSTPAPQACLPRIRGRPVRGSGGRAGTAHERRGQRHLFPRRPRTRQRRPHRHRRLVPGGRRTRLNPAAGSIYFGGSSGATGTGGSTSNVRPSTPRDEDSKIKAAMAKLSKEDRRLAEAQGFCPILKRNRLGAMGAAGKSSCVSNRSSYAAKVVVKGPSPIPREPWTMWRS